MTDDPLIHQAVRVNVRAAIRQLNKSDRGRETCKLLFAFLKSETVKGLDGFNQDAVHALVTAYMGGNGTDADHVMTSLRAVAMPWPEPEMPRGDPGLVADIKAENRRARQALKDSTRHEH